MFPIQTSNWQGWVFPGVVLALGVVGFGWALILRARSARQTSELEEARARERAALKDLQDERPYRTWFRESPAPLLMLSPEGRVLDANQAACDLHGRSVEELRQAGPIPPDMEESLPGEMQSLLLAGGGAVETLRTGAQGRVVPVELRGVPVDLRGSRAVLVHELDLTTVKRQESALREGQERYRALVEVLSEGVVLVDAEGRVATANLAAERILASGGSLVGKDLRSPGFQLVRMDGSPLAAAESPVMRTLGTGETQRDEVVGIRSGSEGAVQWLSVITTPLKRNPAGRVLSVVMCFADITEQVESQRQLRLAKEAAESANRAKTEFLAHMSHEIRTPLNGLTGAHDLLLGSVLTEEQRGFVQTAIRSVEDMLTLLNDLLDLAKIETGRLELVRETFELRPMLEASIRPFRPGSRNAGIDLSLEVDNLLPIWVVADAHRLRQVLTNLVSNAVKFTLSGSVRITVEAVGPDRARFRVADTGIGIAQENLGLIFEAFRQADDTICRRFGGTGLGLAICRQLVGLMQGRIWVESEIGKGSCFFVEVPIGLGKAPDSVPVKPSAPSSSAFLAVPVSTRVLIVEDHPVNRQVTETMVQKLGLGTTVASDGREALEWLQRETFCLVLMDIQMPEMDGLSATRVWREREQAMGLPRTPIVALTAHALPEDRTACLEAGMDDYLCKPLRREALSEMFVRHLGGRVELRDPVQPPAPGVSPAPVASARKSPGSLTPNMLLLLRGSNAEGLSRARGALVERSGAEVARALHFVKGGCALLQDPELTALLQSLEADAKAGRWQELESGMSVAEARIARAVDRAETGM